MTSSGDTSRESTRYASDGAYRSLDFCVTAAGNRLYSEPFQRPAPQREIESILEVRDEAD